MFRFFIRIVFLTIVSATILIITPAYSQSYLGLKIGANATKASYGDSGYKDLHSSKYKPGFTGGLVYIMMNKKNFGLSAEVLYSQKGKSIDSDDNLYETNKATYHYIDVPVMFRYKFKQRRFDWYVQLGPELNFWMGGKGTFGVYEPDRDIIIEYDYTINFRNQEFATDIMNVESANRTQIGVAMGGGMNWELENGNNLAVDFRFSLGNTYLGGPDGGSIPGLGLKDNFEFSNNVLSVSVIYYFDILEKARLTKNKYQKRR